MVLLRAFLIASTTLASGRLDSYIPGAPDQTCEGGGIVASCSRLDSLVHPSHCFIPLCCAVAFWITTLFPALVLSSRNRVRELWAAVVNFFVAYAALFLSSYVFNHVSKAWAYSISLHFSVLLMSSKSSPTLLLSQPVYRALQSVALTALYVAACYAGPPLPVWDAPGLPGSCGAVAHMGAWLLTDSVGRAAVWGGDIWRLSGLN